LEQRLPHRKIYPSVVYRWALVVNPLRKWEFFCAVLGYYAASSGNSLPTFRDNLSVPSAFVLFAVMPNGCRCLLLMVHGQVTKRSIELLRG
jgi:hypothetical protein